MVNTTELTNERLTNPKSKFLKLKKYADTRGINQNPPNFKLPGAEYNRYLCLAKTMLDIKTNPNSHHSVVVWSRFEVKLDSREK